MWHWDQGHLAYFQFDALRRIAAFATANDIRIAHRETLAAAVGLPFAVPDTYTPWRNYSRTLKLTLLVSEVGEYAEPTPVAHVLARPGAVTCDEYFHFLVRTFTEPAPALAEWRRDATHRYPLLVALKYLLAKVAVGAAANASLDELIGVYARSGLVGGEDEAEFIAAVGGSAENDAAGQTAGGALRRQARESLLVMAQISYLHVRGSEMTVSLHQEDAAALFQDLTPVAGPREADRDGEIRRLAALFADGSTDIEFDYPHTVVSDVEESGFIEGGKVKRTHIVIERNVRLRHEFFRTRPTAICDVCALDTARSYPWTDRVLDLHHLLPLASGTRVEEAGTTLADLAPVCPTCHRAVHRFYDTWLTAHSRTDFEDGAEALGVYRKAKGTFPGAMHV